MTEISETYRRYVPRRRLYNIVHMDNVSSILSKGIRSHNSMVSCSHKGISLLGVQSRRAEVSFEKLGTKLHDYANLYFDARNPMMYYLLPSYLKSGGREVETTIMVVVLFLAVELALCMAKFLWGMATERSAFSEAVLLKSLPQFEC